MIWFLRLFSAYRELETVNRLLFERLDTVLDQRTAALQEISKLNDRLDAQYRSEIEATRKVADAAARKHGAPIYDLASEIPMHSSAFEPIPKMKPQASDMIAQMEQEFLTERTEMAKRFNQAAA